MAHCTYRARRSDSRMGRRNPISAWLGRTRAPRPAAAGRSSCPTAVVLVSRRQQDLAVPPPPLGDRRLAQPVEIDRRERIGSRAVRLYYASTSRCLVEGVQQLLSRLGIQSRVSTAVPQRGIARGITSESIGAGNQRSFLERIGVHGARGSAGARGATAPRRDCQQSERRHDALPTRFSDVIVDALGQAGTELTATLAAAIGEAVLRELPSRHRSTSEVLEPTQRLHRIALARSTARTSCDVGDDRTSSGIASSAIEPHR